MTVASVHINEVGLRDGLQSQPTLVPLESKLQLAQAMVAAGIASIEATSFVSPKAVPQMADADELFPQLPAADRVRYSALAPNLRALERAGRAGVKEVAVVLSATETMNRRNINMGLDEAREISAAVIRQARVMGMRTKAYVAVAFECPFEGRVSADHVLALAGAMDEAGAHEIVIADTIGAAYPAETGSLMEVAVQRFGAERIAAHFHDTRGFALANIWASFERGVRRFDASLGGLGGCPFAPGAAGNVATEDVVLMFEGCGQPTGVNLPLLREAIRLAESITGNTLGGRSMRWLQAQDARRTVGQVGACS